MELLQAIRRLVARKGGRPRLSWNSAAVLRGTAKINKAKAQNDSCAFLQLPVDIMYLVFQTLEPEHRMVLALTCRALHGFHSLFPNLRHKHLTQVQRLEYLACIARCLPEQWVCEVCLKLHPLDPLDTPQSVESMTCPGSWYLWRETACGRVGGFDERYIRFEHRHVQLALKHLRLLSEPSEYARRLLAVHHHDRFQTHTRGLRARKHEANTLATRYSVYPKAKEGADGQLRYLTLSTWLYQSASQPVSLRAMGDLKICPHLGFEPYHPPPGCDMADLWVYQYDESDQLAQAIKKALAQQKWDPNGVTEICGACHRCPTDFAVQASPDRVELYAWRDLGPEGSPTSLAWRIQVCNNSPGSFNCTNFGPTVYHEPGSVRALYNGASEDLGSPGVTDTERKTG